MLSLRRPSNSRLTRLQLAVLNASVFGVIIATLPLSPIAPDNFAVPKEIVLCAAAFGVLVLSLARNRTIDLLDISLAAFALMPFVRLLMPMPSHVAGLRYAGLSASWIALAMATRWIIRDGYSGPGRKLLYRGLAIALVPPLYETFVAGPVLSFPGRGPGGLFGNRNVLAEAVIAFVPLLLGHLAGRKSIPKLPFVLLCACVALVVVTRCRTAWLAGLCGCIAFWTSLLAFRSERNVSVRWMPGLAAILVGVCAAVMIPNRLQWNTSAPYKESIMSFGHPDQGSAAGRLEIYKNTFPMIAEHSVFGVGPGNWAYEYPPYLSQERTGQLAASVNTLPNSEWLSLVAEGGAAQICAVLLCLVAFCQMIARSHAEFPIQSATAIALGVTIATAALTDNILSRAGSAFFFAIALGFATGVLDNNVRTRLKGTSVFLRVALATVVLAALIGNLVAVSGMMALRVQR